MPKYSLMTVYSAASFQDVEADSPEEALEQVEGAVCLCHYCSKELELGDPHAIVVMDEQGEEVLREGW